MTRFVIVVLGLLLFPMTGAAAGVNRVWSCSYSDCSALTAQSGDLLDTTYADSVVLGSSAGEIRLLAGIALWDEALTAIVPVSLISWDQTIVLNNVAAFPDILSATGTFQFDQPPIFGNPPKLFRFQGSIDLNIGGSQPLNGVSPFYSQPTIKTTLGTWDLLDADASLASFIDVSIFDGTLTATSAYTQFKARGQIKSGSTLDVLNAFKCSDPVVAGTLNTRKCFVIDAQSTATTGIGIENNSTTVNPPGTALTLGSLVSPTSITVTRTVVELGVTGVYPWNIRTLPNPNIVDGTDGQVVTIVVSTDSAIVFTDDFNIELSDNQCAPMCAESGGVDKCTLAQDDTISFVFLDSTGVWHMTGCADNN